MGAAAGVLAALADAGWRHEYSGKVRDLFVPLDGDPGRLLVVASDRVSAFDAVLRPEIPGKGVLLTRLSLWWFAQLAVPNHLLPEAPPAAVAERAMVTKRLDMFPIECVVRGYLTGSGFAEYRERGSVCGVSLPAGLRNGDRLPEPIFTPAFKAPLGEHDENISFDRTVELVGGAHAEELRATSLAVFAAASAIAEQRGVLIADTKFEFGLDGATGRVTLADEVLTSDSSRFWDAEAYRSGASEAQRLASFDKQGVRDWLRANWDQQGTPPTLPADVVEHTAARYTELLHRLVG